MRRPDALVRSFLPAAGLLLSTLLLATLLTGCRAMRTVAAKYPAPDLERVYVPTAPAAAEAGARRNPLVVLPGFGGSELRDAQGRVVWGARFTDDALSFARPEGLRALALEIPDGFADLSDEEAAARLYHLEDDATPAGPMLFFRTEVVTEVEVPVYAGLLVGLATAGYRLDPALADHLNVPRNPDGPPCYVFGYDWRRDLASSAAELGAFLDQLESRQREERRESGLDASEPVRFDLLAHSMAGLLTRYYLRYGAHDVLAGLERDAVPEVTWEGARRVDRAIFVSPPNRGTAKALRNLANGDDSFWMPAYEPALVATWNSVPQMFPPPEPGFLRDAAGRSLELDYFEAATWREHRWGPYRPQQREIIAHLFPDVDDPAERLRRLDAFFAASLRRGERFVRVMNTPASPPPRTTLHLFTGDADLTLARGRAMPKGGGLRLLFEETRGDDTEPGDGSVTRRSALGDLRPAGSRQWLRSAVPWTSVVFLSDRHAGLLSNRVLQDNLLHLLLETPPVHLTAP